MISAHRIADAGSDCRRPPRVRYDPVSAEIAPRLNQTARILAVFLNSERTQRPDMTISEQTALIGIGGNIGDTRAIFDSALTQLAALPDVRIEAVSDFIITPPVGPVADQPDFLNGAVLVKTILPPLGLLDRLQDIETGLGRNRATEINKGPRTLDLDILLYGELSVSSDRLTTPHPELTKRLFVLEPSAQIAPEMIHPKTGKTIRQLLADLMKGDKND